MHHKKETKVCHFSSVHSIYDTRVFERECTWLAKDFNVTLIGIGNFSGVSNGVKVLGVKKPAKPFYRFFSTIWIVFFKAVNVNARIYHIHDAELIPFALLLRLFNKKVIYDIHENTAGDIMHKTWIPKWQRKTMAAFYNLLLNTAANFLYYIPVVWHTKDALILKCKKNRFTIIQNFAPLHFFKQFRVKQRSQLPNNLFYVGMIKDSYYNIYNVFDAMLLLKEEGILTHLHCVGYFGINTKPDFTDYDRFFDVEEMITFYGKLNTYEAYNISKKCKIGICLKNQPDEMVISHERKLFEYIACGLPAIMSNSGIYRDIVNNYQIGITTDLNNITDIKNKLKLLLTDNTLINTIEKKQVEIADTELNWEKEYLKLYNLYKSLI